MSESDCIDYKAPIGTADDHRTSYYFAHKYIKAPAQTPKTKPINYADKYMYQEDPILKLTYTSESRDNYTWKTPPPNAPRYTSIPNAKFMKGYVEKQMKFIPRPLKPAVSVSHEQYQWKANLMGNKSIPLQQSIEPATVTNRPIVVNPAHPCIIKYLDPGATTYKLNFVHRTPTEIMSGIANMDNITVWNWSKMKTKLRNISNRPDVQMCNYLPSNLCGKRSSDEKTEVLHVPNSGLTTEIRENYNPMQLKRTIDEQEIHNCLSYLPMVPLATDTESKIIGSGHMVQRYVA